MWILLILLGLVTAGIVGDFVVENHLTTAPDQAFLLFGRSFELSRPKLALATAILGALAILFLGLGVGRLRGRRGRRRGLKALEQENTELRAKLHLVTAVSAVPHSEPVAGSIEGVGGPQ